MHLPVRLAGVALLVAAVATPGAAQHAPVPPSTWAITGARIEPVSGPAIAKGTIVIRDGLIVAVGANVAAPADARLIDGSGMTVYPGLIDAAGSLGFPSGNAGGGGGGGGGGAASRATAPNSNYGPGMQAELRAVDQLDPSATAFTAARGAGVTAALTAPAAGIFRGTSALIALRDAPVGELVIRDGIAQHIGFSRGGGGGFGGGGGYPGSLMGVFAQLRQELLDAQHYRDLQAAYARNPRGMVRPDHDPTLAALQPVIAGTQPVVLFANSEREIIRALDLAAEFGLRPIIAGGTEAWKVADRIKAANAPVLLSIDFPRKSAGGGAAAGRGGRSGADSTPEPLRVLRDRVDQPKGAGRLAAAGVRVAFVSGNDYGELPANLRRAVEGGLDKAAALRAMTLEPATLFGVADRLGTIEAGKIANLTLVTGDLFEAGGKVSQVFIDGERYEIPAAATPAAQAPRRAPASAEDDRAAGTDDHDHPAR
ncbi:MAG: amidohydrolase family protein [Gemmatimonadales bacterium]